MRETATPQITVGDGFRMAKPATLAAVTPDMMLHSVDVRELIERLDDAQRDGARIVICP